MSRTHPGKVASGYRSLDAAVRARRSRRSLLQAGAAGLTAAALVACGSSARSTSSGSTVVTRSGASSPGPAAAAAGIATPARAAATPSLATPIVAGNPTPGGSVNLVALDVPNYDYQVSFQVLQTLYMNRLLRYQTGAGIDPNQYDIIPDLAARYEQPSPDHVVFTLNPAAKFHDKPPVGVRTVTSEDVKSTFALLSTQQPQYVYRYLVDFIQSVEAPAADTVSITLTYPTLLVFNTLAYYNSAIAPKEIIDRDGNLQKVDIGTGPFTFDSYDKGAAFTFKKNPAYFLAGQPYLNDVQLNVIADPSAALDALSTGKVDGLDLTVDQVAAAKRTLSKDYTLTSVPGVGWSAFIFNTQQAPYGDLRVRQAFHYALDRKAIATLVAQGNAAIRTGPLARGWPQWTRSDDEVNKDAVRDVQKAKQLLTAAGFPNGLDTEWVYGSVNPAADLTLRIAQVAQEQLRDAGIRMKITVIDYTAWNKRLQTHDFGFSEWAIRAYPDPDDYLYPFFVPNGAKNFGLVNDPTLTALILKQRQAPDAATRKQVLQDIDRRWNDEFAYFLWQIEPPFTHAFNGRLKNYAPRNPLDYAGLAATYVAGR